MESKVGPHVKEDSARQNALLYIFNARCPSVLERAPNDDRKVHYILNKGVRAL